MTVANPRRVQLISPNDSKDDRTDAELLARLGRADRELLAPIEHRGNQAQADLAVAKARDALVRCRTTLVNHARGVVKSFGERLPKCTAASFHKKARASVREELKPALEPIFRVLGDLASEIKECDRAMTRIAKRYPDVQVLSQPDGVGLLTALVYLLTLEDKARFKKSRSVGAFLGLRPKKDQSGEGDKQPRITKAGDPFLRRLLVGSANFILGASAPSGRHRTGSQHRSRSVGAPSPRGPACRGRQRAAPCFCGPPPCWEPRRSSTPRAPGELAAAGGRLAHHVSQEVDRAALQRYLRQVAADGLGETCLSACDGEPYPREAALAELSKQLTPGVLGLFGPDGHGQELAVPVHAHSIGDHR